MKIKLVLCLLAVAALPACTTTKTTSTSTTDAKSSRYANNSVGEPAPVADGPTADIPAAGPAELNANPAYLPTPLLRGSAAASP